MKKLFVLIIALAAVLSLSACGDGDVPDGMQYVSGSDAEGYYFYAPEAWVVANVENIDTVYVSRIDNTSVSLVEIEADSFGTVSEGGCTNTECKGASLDGKAHYFLYHYFDDSKASFPASLSASAGADVIFGAEGEGADRAVKYEFSYVYTDIGYGDETADATCGFIQYYLLHDGAYYLMTYSAVKDVPEGLSTSKYDQHLEELDTIVDNFRFVTKSGDTTADEKTEGERDEDGYVLVTDSRYSGFDFYAPEGYEVDFTSGIVSVSAPDGSNVTMTKATATGLSTVDYIERRKKELEQIGATDFTLLTDLEAEGQQNGVATNLGNVPKGDVPTSSDFAFEFEYTYKYNGVTYHVYQIIAVEGFLLWIDGYVFTYTATEANFDQHFDDVKTMRDKVNFK